MHPSLSASSRNPSSVELSSNCVAACEPFRLVPALKLMGELQTACDYLQSEGERVRQMMVRYAHLAQTASVKIFGVLKR